MSKEDYITAAIFTLITILVVAGFGFDLEWCQVLLLGGFMLTGMFAIVRGLFSGEL